MAETNDKRIKKETLWCLPYDTDSVFKPFLKVSFSTFLKNLISNQYFEAYQQSMMKELKDVNMWNQKCWKIISFFQFLNDSFQLNKWDENITFIEDTILRNTMGYFRLWIDTERLYLLNFLKLDSNEFQEDRIYMCLFRTLIYFNVLFSEYLLKDFEPNFLANFIRQSSNHLNKLLKISTNQVIQIIEGILKLLNNIRKKQSPLISPVTINQIKKGAIIKVTKQAETIKDVQERLMNSAAYKKKIDQRFRLMNIAKRTNIDQLVKKNEESYQPLLKMKLEYELEAANNTHKVRSQQQTERLDKQYRNKQDVYKKAVKQPDILEVTPYESLEQNTHNPYILSNYLLYGTSVSIDINAKQKYIKQKEAQVTSIEDYDRSKIYYEDSFIRGLQDTDASAGKVTVRDLNLNRKIKKNDNFKQQNQQDQNTKVFNLKWHSDPSSKRMNLDTAADSKNYDNNLLFKNPLQDQLNQRKRKDIDKYKEQYDCKSYTIAFLEKQSDEIHPQHINSSFGSNMFVKKETQILDVMNFKLLNQNKFDFMRKVVGYMTAQKKIKAVINQKNLPDNYPRVFADIKQHAYNPQFQNNKAKFVLGKTNRRPDIYL